MIKLPPKSPLQPLLIRRAVEVILLVGLIGAAMYGYEWVKTKRQQALAQQAMVEQRPHELLETSTRRTDLREYQDNITALEQIIIKSDQLGEAISYLERIAAAEAVEVSIPDVKEVINLRADGQPIARTGPTFEINLSATAVGSPTGLLQFLYQVEHAPYLLDATTWRLELQPTRLPPFANQSLPINPPGEESQEPSPAVLSADIIITVQNDEAKNH